MHLPTLPEKHFFTVQRLPTSQCAQPLFQGSGVFLEEVKDGLQSQRKWMSVAKQYLLNMTVLHTWTHSTWQHLDQASQNPQHRSGRSKWNPTQLRSFWELMAAGRGKGCSPQVALRAPVDSPTPMHTPVALNRYNGREKQGQGGIGCKGWGDELDQNTYMHVWNSPIILKKIVYARAKAVSSELQWKG